MDAHDENCVNLFLHLDIDNANIQKTLESANATRRVPVADILESGTPGEASGSTSRTEPKQTSRVSYCLLNII